MSDDSGVERLKKKLYRRSGGPEPRPRRELHDRAYDVGGQWVHEEDVEAQQAAEESPEAMLEALREGRVGPVAQEPRIFSDVRNARAEAEATKGRRLVTRIIQSLLAASAVFFVLSVGIAGYFFMFDKNRVSCDNLDVNISGPVAIPAGRELALQVGITNKNPVAMQLTDLVIRYPDGARSPTDLAVPLPSVREQIGTIDAGERVRSTARAVLFGEENEQQTIETTVEYRIEDSNALFSCTVPYAVVLSSAPVSLTVDGLEQISSGQQLVLDVTVTSNSDSVLSDLLLVADYPIGFEVTAMEPPARFSDRVWSLGDIGPGQSRSIKITGFLSGQNDEERAFRFSTGGQSPSNPEELVTAYQTTDHVIALEKPFIGLTMGIDGDDGKGEATVLPGELIHGTITWANQLPYPLYDVTIEAVIDGPLLREQSVDVDKGFFRSQDNTVLYTPQTNDALEQVGPGERGTLSFSLQSYQLRGDTSARDPIITIELKASGRRVADDSPVPEVIEAQAKRTIKLASDLQFAPRVLYTIGPFTNTGSHPPRAEQTTTYTIVWGAANTTNDVVDVAVTGRLPVYVEWLNTFDPNNESLQYDPVTRQITWRVGDVPAGTGFQVPSREVAFQISLAPSVSQIGSEPILVENQVMRGVDRFTNSMLEERRADLTTRITTDPNILWAPGRVLP